MTPLPVNDLDLKSTGFQCSLWAELCLHSELKAEMEKRR